jgi:hypothetical protein
MPTLSSCRKRHDAGADSVGSRLQRKLRQSRERLHAALPEAIILVLDLPTPLSWRPLCHHVPLLVRTLYGRLAGNGVGDGVECSRTTLETFRLVQWGPTGDALPDDESGTSPTLCAHAGISQLVIAPRIRPKILSRDVWL